MAVTSTFVRQWTDGSETLNQQNAISDSGIQKISLSGANAVVAGATAQLVDIVLPTADIKGIFISCDQACVIKTNSSGSPIQTFTFPAGGGYLMWDAKSVQACPITTGITALYIANPTAVDANLEMRFVTHLG